MSNLKSCPFCGGEAFIRQNKDAMKTYSAYCGNEDCSASPKVSAYGKEMVIELWNTRKPIEKIMERLEELEEEYMYPDDEDYVVGQYDAVRECLAIVKEEGGLNEL